jgi:uncharacterized protein YukE
MRPADGGGSSYPADMQPIPFPTAQATAAKTACERIASLLDRHLQARPGMVASARDGWEGAYRTEFDETWRTQEVRLNGLREDLRTLAGRIGTAMSNASTLNAQRANARADYDADHRTPAGAN